MFTAKWLSAGVPHGFRKAHLERYPASYRDFVERRT
jgi:hypothetical protein